MSTLTHSTLWVCVGCLTYAELDDLLPETDRTPWGLYRGGRAFLGLHSSEHADDCPNRDYGTGADWAECECDRITYSRRSCDGCGSSLHGARYAYTSWNYLTR